MSTNLFIQSFIKCIKDSITVTIKYINISSLLLVSRIVYLNLLFYNNLYMIGTYNRSIFASFNTAFQI